MPNEVALGLRKIGSILVLAQVELRLVAVLLDPVVFVEPVFVGLEGLERCFVIVLVGVGVVELVEISNAGKILFVDERVGFQPSHSFEDSFVGNIYFHQFYQYGIANKIRSPFFHPQFLTPDQHSKQLWKNQAYNFKLQKSVMFSKDHFSSLPYGQHKRPHTPLASSNYNPNPVHNKSYTKLNAPSYSPHGSHFPNGPQHRQNQMSKSRVSVNSSASQLSFLHADQGQVFPDDLIFLLRNQEKNINSFKQKIEKEKGRVENDFAVLKLEIDHLMEDLKLSVQAELDQVYKVFISKYAEVKGEVQEIRRLRKEIIMANHAGGANYHPTKDTSNHDILNEIEKDAEHFRNYKVYGYLSEMQKNKINPILEVCNELILIGSADCPFYKAKEMSMKTKEIKSTFSGVLADVYKRLDEYVVSPEYIINKQREEEENSNNVLRHLQQENNKQPIRNIFDAHYPQNSPPRNSQAEMGKKKNVQYTHSVNTWEVAEQQLPPVRNVLKKIGRTQQGAIVKWAEGFNLRKTERVITDHQDSILCIFFIDNQFIATGSKDKTINIYDLEGKKLTTLQGHDASICSLSTVKTGPSNTFLASGSDHGCCCLILWDIRTWTIASRIQAHVAAVTSIVDLDDGEHLLTGSYDKKINLFNHRKGEVISSYSNKSGVTSMVLTTDKQKVVSCGLENSMIIWSVVSKLNGLGLEQIKVINNNAMICTIEPSLLRPDVIFAATRDGKIKVYNLSSSSELEKVYTVNENSIIELVAIQREIMSDCPLIVSTSSKDKSLCVTRMDSGQSELVKVNGPFNIEFGCGIGPKIVLSSQRGGLMAILSQASGCRQFSLYEMQFK